jgi:arylsulfatase A-like enzyme
LAAGSVQGWSYYLTAPEIAFEVSVRLVFAALAGMALGTLLTIAAAPFLWHFESSRERLIAQLTNAATGLAVFLDGWFAVAILIGTFQVLGRYAMPLQAAYFLAFAAVLSIPRGRNKVATSLDVALGEKTTRRTAIATGLGVTALGAAEFAVNKTLPVPVRAAAVARRPRRNILLITFDALSAEDMSVYGCALPTTPNIDAFAGKSTVFTNFYSTSTFTTPSVATMLTGLYPSESHVYHLQGRLRGAQAGRTLPHLMRAAGYATGASITNPYAYHLAEDLASDYDSLPEPVYGRGSGPAYLWAATAPLHPRLPMGSPVEEFFNLEAAWDFIPDQLERWKPRRFGRRQSRYPAAASFEQAREVLAHLPDGFFLWVHVMAPHFPYLPDAPDLGRFLSTDEGRTVHEQLAGTAWPIYPPDRQIYVDKARLRYDEFVAGCDRAFGAFMADCESRGRLRDTAVVVSADHGESFEGGAFLHDSRCQNRPMIHIPLIVRPPNQREGRRVAFSADQTALAPTILDLAGLPKPASMSGKSLAGWLDWSGQGEGEGIAFTQYLEHNSVFKPLENGTVGAIDGRHQYVIDLATGRGMLRPLNEAQVWDLDRSVENPDAAAALRAAICSRFPDLAVEPA